MRHSKLSNILTKAANYLDRRSRQLVGKCGSPMVCIPATITIPGQRCPLPSHANAPARAVSQEGSMQQATGLLLAVTGLILAMTLWLFVWRQ